MEPVTKTRDPDAKLKGFPLPNGTEKNTHRTPPPPLLPAADEEEKVLYRECLKNHAASLGTHALDGCGEFMPSLEANPADPTSLKCAACGCHRNFHRRITSPHRAAAASASGDDGLEGVGERDGQDDDGEEDADVDDSRPRSPSPPPPPYFTSAPHMLLALSSGVRGGDSPAGPGRPFTTPTSMVAVPPLRKRFRTKFSPEQKDRMLELSERLGWRLHRRDEEFVEKYCDEIGVGKGVFKVWMHNNKHHLFGHSASRRETGNGVSPSAFPGSGAGLHKPDGNGNAMNGAV